MGRSVLPSQGFHARLHDRARLHGGLKPEFDKRNVKIIGLSVDPVENHAQWSNDIEETQGHAPNYPMIGDTELADRQALRHDPAARRQLRGPNGGRQYDGP